MTNYAAIGRYWASTLSQINYAGSEWFVPAPYDGQDCLTQQTFITRLQAQLQMWNDNLLNSTNSKEQANLAAIIDIQQGKLDAYIAAQNSKCGIPSGTDPVKTEHTLPPDPAGGGSSNQAAAIPFFILIAAGMFLIPKLLNNKKK